MIYGLYQSAAGMLSSQYRQDVVANNLANVSTPGFKQDLAALMERRPAFDAQGGGLSPVWDRMTGGHFAAPTLTDFSTGRIETTGNDLDIAVEGEGFLTVKAGDQVRYTRDGRMTLSSTGQLILQSSGAAVLDAGGSPVTVDPARPIDIRPDGRVMQGDTEVARLGAATFADTSALTKAGGNLFAATGQPQAAKAQIRPRAIEASNVEATRELVSMMETTREFELNAAMLRLQSDTLGRAVNDVARIA